MTKEEKTITIIRQEYLCVDKDCDIERSCGKCDLAMPSKEPILEAYDIAIKAIDMWDKLFKSYETLTTEITESGDAKNATKRIDDWCVEQLRGIISNYYAEKIIEGAKE